MCHCFRTAAKQPATTPTKLKIWKKITTLGKWYYEGEGKNRYQEYPEFRQLEEPHRQVHESGLEALKAAAANDPQRCLVMTLKMEQASKEVFTRLSALEKKGQTVSAAPGSRVRR